MIKEEKLLKVLLAPCISEKNTGLGENFSQYVFKVTPCATKLEIKKAVEWTFNVKVDAVRISNVKAKAKRFGQIEGKRKGWKKAYVSLQKDQKIDLLGEQV